jgi:hypothetical protein
MEKRHKPGDAACERRSIHRAEVHYPVAQLRRSTWAIQLAGWRRPADGASATVCKAACLNTQQTVKNDVNLPLRGAAVLRGSFYGKASNQTGM